MISPTMTVLVLAVLWLIVVIPMFVKRKDDRAGERSVARFGGAMRALSSRGPVTAHTRPAAAEDRPRRRRATHAQVFIPGGPARPQVPPAGRRPVPAAMEAVMYPDQIAKADMSDARRQMMARRRRSLAILAAGTIIGLLWVLIGGGGLAWTVALLFTASLASYLLFLRNQALRDRDRREQRQQRSGLTKPRGYDATEQFPYRADSDTVVRIDDEDVQLRGVADTVDLTGLYVEEQFDERSMRRAV
ncbi:MAG TPA: hypothetical protein VF557_12845 [Jatrophihabitans sp.]|jgi:membrane protein implicated in regulation of membrane protease activity|uniref:hypothetical protein n=1 Tax=Jatrophihabitans sp. TaxID=1932789 RepID=UPI002EF1B4F6